MKKKMKKLLIGGLAMGGLAAVYMATRRKDTFSVVLKENLTEGWMWKYSLETEGIIKEYSNDYTPCFGASESGDDYGQHKWTFAPLRTGETMLRFEYIRPWESKEGPCAYGVYKVTVDADHKALVELVESSDNYQTYALMGK